MRSLAVQRYSAAAAIAALSAAALQAANLGFAIPEEQLKLAWTLARILIEL